MMLDPAVVRVHNLLDSLAGWGTLGGAVDSSFTTIIWPAAPADMRDLLWALLSCWLLDCCRGWNRLHAIRTFPQIVRCRVDAATTSRGRHHHISLHSARLSAVHNHNAGTETDDVVQRLFSKDSTCSQSEVDEFFRDKLTLTVNHVGTVLDGPVGMKKRRRIDVLKKIHLVHITNELRKSHQEKRELKSFGVAALVYCLQATTKDDAQTSGM
jgi:hypothetical protein